MLTNTAQILIVDDEPNNHRVYEVILKDLDLKIVKAMSGKEALTLANMHNFFLILMDVQMPIMDGFETASLILRHPKTSHIPIIFITAFAKAQTFEFQGYKTGAVDYLIKPINEGILKSKVRVFHELYQKTHELELAIIKRDEANRQLEDINQRLEEVITTSQSMTTCVTLEGFREAALPEFAGHMSAIGGSIYLVEKRGLRLLRSLDDGHAPEFIPFPLAPNSIFRNVIESKHPLFVKDMGREHRVNVSGWKGYSNGSALIFPIPNERGQTTAVLSMHCSKNGAFSKADEKIGQILAHQIAQTLIVIDAFEELRGQKNVVRKLKDFLTDTINSMSSALICVDIEMTITQWNDAAAKLVGVPAQNALGLPLAEVIPWLRNDVGGIEECIRSEIPSYDRNRLRLTTDGTVYEDLTVFPLLSHMAKGAGIRIENVTERVKMERIVVQTEKMSSIAGLAAGMAHEINNPLAIITQSLQIIMRMLDTSAEKNIEIAEDAGLDLVQVYDFLVNRKIIGMLEAGNEAVDRAANIVRNMLMFSRKSDSKLLAVDIPHLIDKSIELGASDYDSAMKYDFKFTKINKEYDLDLPPVMCCPVEIEQVFLNIFKNGVQAMELVEADGYKPEFNIRIIKEPEHLRIEIEDNGTGMPEHVRRCIFEPFFTTKSVNTGTGLGLSVSYSIITQNHGGYFLVESEEGLGTTFIIGLPL